MEPNGQSGFTVVARDGGARQGRLLTGHGAVETPAFMPVGSKGAVKAMAPDELWALGYRLILANAYHLNQRPGERLVQELGGLHRFMAWPGALLTESRQANLGYRQWGEAAVAA